MSREDERDVLPPDRRLRAGFRAARGRLHRVRRTSVTNADDRFAPDQPVDGGGEQRPRDRAPQHFELGVSPATGRACSCSRSDRCRSGSRSWETDRATLSRGRRRSAPTSERSGRRRPAPRRRSPIRTSLEASTRRTSTFDHAGTWQVDATVAIPGAGDQMLSANFTVSEQHALPAPGDRAQPTENLTVHSTGVPTSAIDSRALDGAPVPIPTCTRRRSRRRSANTGRSWRSSPRPRSA